MAQYKTDFIEYITGSQPSDWTERWDTTNSTWSVEDEGIGSPSDNVLRHTASADGQRLLSWNDIDTDANRDDVEILCKFRSSSSDLLQNRFTLRASGSAGSEEAYNLDAIFGTDEFRIRKFLTSGKTTLATTSFTFNIDTYYWIRFRANSTTLRAKVWQDGSSEPGSWTLDTSDSSISVGGWVGVGSFESSGNHDFDFISIATNGETAEGPDLGQAAAARNTQSAVLALAEGTPDTRITQSAVLALYQPAPDARVTQAPALVLAQFDADTRISQAPVLALVDQVECLTRWAQAWRIERVDGEIFLFTDLDRVLTFRGENYQPCDSLNASATEMATLIGAAGNQELSGIISDTGIKEEDLYNGLFDNATVEIWSVPWENQGGEIPFRLITGRIGDIDQGVQRFNAEIVTPIVNIQQRPLLRKYTPSCRWILGDNNCTVDLDSLAINSGVTGTVLHNASTNSSRRVFIDSSRFEESGFFDQGTIEWTSGDNSGITSEIKSFDGSTFTLWEPLLAPIQIGDSFTAKPGCNKLAETCKDKFDNFDNFGGFPHVPGNDAIRETPPSR